MFKITGSKIPDGQYVGELVSVNESSGKYGPQRKWLFILDVPQEDGTVSQEELSGITSSNVSPGSKAHKWLSGLVGKPLQTGDEINPIGMKGLIYVAANEKGFATIQEIVPYAEPQQVLPGVPR